MVKCSAERRPWASAWAFAAAKNAWAMSPWNRRSRFFVKRVGSRMGIIHGERDELAEEEVVVQLLHELPLAPHTVEGLEEQRPKELPGRDQGAAGM